MTNIGEAAFNALFVKCPVVRGLRSVYVRTSTLPATFNAFDVFANTWSSENNKINEDFSLYSNIADAKSDSNRWTYCNYGNETKHIGVGFPRDCGPSSHIGGHKFFAMPGTLHSNNVLNMDNDGIDNGLEIYTGDDCPSVFGGKFMHRRTFINSPF